MNTHIDHSSSVLILVCMYARVEIYTALILQFPVSRTSGRLRKFKCGTEGLTLFARYSQTQDLFTSRLQGKFNTMVCVYHARLITDVRHFIGDT